MHGFNLMDVITLFVIASLVVLVVMNPNGFSKDVASVGSYSIAQTSLFTGSGYNSSKFGKMQ